MSVILGNLWADPYNILSMDPRYIHSHHVPGITDFYQYLVEYLNYQKCADKKVKSFLKVIGSTQNMNVQN